MAYTLNYSSKSLLNVKFEPNVKGYDPFEVDQVLDKLINDLEFYEKYYSDSYNYIRTLETEVQNLKNKIRDMEMEVASIKNKYSGIKPGQEVNEGNINYIKRISKLEEALYKKGVDPDDIK